MNLPLLLLVIALGPSKLQGKVQDKVAPVDGEIQGSSRCSRVNGCKTIETMFCEDLSHDGECKTCFYNNEKTDERNILRSDFYRSVNNEDYMNRLKSCLPTGSSCPFLHANEMAKYMLIKDDRIARSAQGAIFKRFNIPKDVLESSNRLIPNSYKELFCDEECVLAMKEVCLGATLVTHIRNWCMDVVEWVGQDLPRLKGPPSYVAYLAAKATYSGQLVSRRGTNWPRTNNLASRDEKAVLVAAAAASILLTGHWWNHFTDSQLREMDDFGFAVQHSLFIAIYAGRLRISIQQADMFVSFEPGTKAYCSAESASKSAPNFSGATGNVFAAICATFSPGRKRIKLRYRPEIHGLSDEGCVERTAGMAFIMPGDWITTEYEYQQIGSLYKPDGVSFRNKKSKRTPLELYSSGVAQLFAPAIAEDLQVYEETSCTGNKKKGGGKNLGGSLARARVQISGICNWVVSW